MMELTRPVAVSEVVTKSSVETAGSAFSSVRNVSGAGETRCGFSSTVRLSSQLADGYQQEPCHYSVAGNALRV
jgi:hypothetical protein